MRQDVSINVPTAIGHAQANLFGEAQVMPTKDDLLQMQGALIRELEGQVTQKNLALGVVSNVAMATTALLIQLGHGLDVDEISVPVELRDRYEGGHITIGEDPDRSYIIRIRQRNEPKESFFAIE